MLLSRSSLLTWRCVRVLPASTQFRRSFTSTERKKYTDSTHEDTDTEAREPRLSIPTSQDLQDSLKDSAQVCLSKSNLQVDVIQKLQDSGISHLLEVQHKTFDTIITGKNTFIQARTGTGKTLAYVLPILQNVQQLKKSIPPVKQKYLNKAERKQRANKKYSPLAVIIAPTRELAVQIHKELERYKPDADIKVSCFYGGGVSYKWQDAEVREGIDILVATPGRLCDHLLYRYLSFKTLRHLVLDEADRMFDMGFESQLEQILQRATYYENKPQMLLFSATLPDYVAELAQRYMEGNENVKRFDFVSGGVRTTLTVEHIAVKCHWSKHGEVINYLMKLYGGETQKSIVFVSNRTRADELASHPALLPTSGVLHSALSQSKRELMLTNFREGTVKCLIATDVASRGLDVLDVGLVVQCEPPSDADDFVHRAGRTGRLGKKGVNVVLCDGRDLAKLENIEEMTGVQFRLQSVQRSEILQSEAEAALESLNKVSSHSRQPFVTTAELMIQKHGAENALAAALAVLSGRGRNPKDDAVRMDYDRRDTRLGGDVRGRRPERKFPVKGD